MLVFTERSPPAIPAASLHLLPVGDVGTAGEGNPDSKGQALR